MYLFIIALLLVMKPFSRCHIDHRNRRNRNRHRLVDRSRHSLLGHIRRSRNRRNRLGQLVGRHLFKINIE
jgi:hypothetical protein